jgi:hypothetical protein
VCGQAQVFRITFDLTEEKDMAVTFFDSPEGWVKEVFDRGVILRQKFVMEIKD